MLTFIRTESLAEFKERCNADALEVHQNSRTEKYYFTCGEVRGAVSANYFESKGQCPVVSLVKPEEGDSFYLLHSKDAQPGKAVQSL